MPDKPRAPEQRAADHAAIERLTDDLVPALIAKLSASGLGEIEVGEDRWTVRVRRPAEGASSQSRRSGDRASRSQPGHGHGPAGFDGHRGVREAGRAAAHSSSNGSAPAGDGASDGPGSHRVVATSPAVGVFQPRTELTPGTKVRSGDRLGAVDVLGIPQEVLAPSDGILGASLAEPGQAVEYGQELIVIELAGRSGERAVERSDG